LKIPRRVMIPKRVLIPRRVVSLATVKSSNHRLKEKAEL